MKKINTLRLLTLATLASLTAAPSFAQDAEYFYGGLSLGQSRANIDEDRIIRSLLGLGLTPTSISRDERDTAYRVFGGYQFNRNFALEAGYFNLGKFGFTSMTSPAGTLNGEMKLQGFNLDLVGTLPLSENLSAIGRVGAAYTRTSDSFSGTGAVIVRNPNPRTTKTNVKAGVGLQYAFTPSLLVRGEAEQYRVDDAMGDHARVNVYSVSLVFPFDRPAAPIARTVSQVTYVEPAPVPAPAPAPTVTVAPSAPIAVMPPPRKRVSFSAESLFGFDKTALKPEGMAALDKFARELETTQFDTVTVEGHTDRLGTAEYNQRLSLQRAESVKSYLVTSGHMNPAKITIVGKGESTPVTAAGACKGNNHTAQLVTCLQPDRRVDVEVTGTRQ